MAINVWKENPYEETSWHDDIRNPHTGLIIEEGTPFLARYANNIEKGIINAHEGIMALQSEMQRMLIWMELDGRAPGNSGTIADNFDSSGKSPLEMTETVINAPIEAGATTVTVDSANGLVAFTEVTIYDDVSREDVLITAISGNTLTVQSLQYTYKKGARVARSTVSIDTTNREMLTGAWTTYSVALVEVV